MTPSRFHFPSRRHRPLRCAGSTAMVLGVLLLTPFHPEAAPDGSARMAERYEQMVLRRPRLGPSLEKLIQLKSASGTFDDWMADLATAEEGSQALLLGLVHFQQGRLKLAAEALDRAVAGTEEAWYPRFVRGRVGVLQREYEVAEQSFASAADRVERPEDLVQVLKALGRCQLRLERVEDARATWERLIELDPEDFLTMEEVADTLADEGALADALALIERLRDREGQSAYQRMKYELRRAELLARMERGDDALSAWRSILSRVEEESWFYREALARIEAGFRARRDLEGLEAFYRSAAEERPESVGLRLAWAALLAERDQPEEAVALLEDYLPRAPKHPGLRRKLADLLPRVDRFDDAVGHYEALIREMPRDPELPRALGELYAARMQTHPEARVAAVRWFKHLATVDAQSVPYALQSAEALLAYGFQEAALEQLDVALARGPDVLDTYRTKAELLLQLDREPEALATIAAMTAGSRRTAASLQQAAEALRANQLMPQALATAREAVNLAPEAFEPAFLLLKLLQDQEIWVEVRERAPALAERAPNAYFKDQIIDLEITALEQLDLLEDTFVAGSKARNPDADACLRLARMALALQRHEAARQWVERALEANATVDRLETAAHIYRQLGQPWAQIELLEKVMERSPAVQADTARRLVGLYERVGEPGKALTTAQEVVRALPGNREAIQLYTELLQRQGRNSDALGVLERAARANDDDLVLLGRLAELYRQQRRTDQALATYWKLFRRTEDGQARLGFVRPLFELYVEDGGFEAFEERLREETREVDDASLRPLALSWALQLSGRLDEARAELEKVLALQKNDIRALKRLVDLARAEGAVREAIRYQKQVVEVEPDALQTRLLADLHYEIGDEEQARGLWRETVDRVVVTDANRSSRYFDWVNTLILRGMLDEAVRAVQDVEPRFKDNWAVTYRVARAYAILDRPKLATPVFLRLLEWPEDLSGDADPVEAGPPPPPSIGTPAILQRISIMRGQRQGPHEDFPGVRWDFGGMDLPPDFALPGKISFIRLNVVRPDGAYGSYQAWRPSNLTELKVATLAFLEHLATLDEQAARWREADSLASEPFLAEVQAYLRGDLDALEQGLQAWRSGTAASARSAWMVLAVRLDRLRRDRGEATADRYFTLLHELREQVPEQTYLMDVLAWHGRLLHGTAEEREAVARNLAAHDQLDFSTRNRFVQQLMQLGLQELAVEQLERLSEEVSQPVEGEVDPLILSQLRTLIDQWGHLGEPQRAYPLFGVFLARHREITRAIMDGKLLRPTWMGTQSRSAFPGPNPWCDASMLQVVRTLSMQARKDQTVDELVQLLEKAMPQAGEARVGPATSLAALYAWQDRQEEAARWLGEAVVASAYDSGLVQQHIQQLRKLDRPAEALALTDRVKPGPDFPPKDYYMLRMDLAAEAKREEVAVAAAKRLVYMTLDAREMGQLAGRLREWDLDEEAAAVEARAAVAAEARLAMGGGTLLGGVRSIGNLHQEVQFLDQLQRKGQTERARTMAMRLLDLALDPVSWDQQAFVRQRCQRVLESIEGGMAGYVAQCSERLERSPQSPTLLKRTALAKFLVSDKQGAGELVDRLAAIRSEDMRHQAEVGLIRHLLGDWEGARRQFDLVLARRPGILFSERSFLEALGATTFKLERDRELAATLQEIGYHRLVSRLGVGLMGGAGTQPGLINLLNFAQKCVDRSTPLPEVALSLADLLDEGLPAGQRRNFATRMGRIRLDAYELLKQPEEAFALFSAMVLPQEILQELDMEMEAVEAGFPLHRIDTRGSRVITDLDRYVQQVVESGKADRVLAAFDRAAEKGPMDEWARLVRVHLALARLTPEAVAADASVLPDPSSLWSEEAALLANRSANTSVSRVPVHMTWALYVSLGNQFGRLGVPEPGIRLVEYAHEQYAAHQFGNVNEPLLEQLLDLYTQAGDEAAAIDFLANRFIDLDETSPTRRNIAKEHADRMALRQAQVAMDHLLKRKAWAETAELAHRLLTSIDSSRQTHYIGQIKKHLDTLAQQVAVLRKTDPARWAALQEEWRGWRDQVQQPVLTQWLDQVLPRADSPAPTPAP